jgi:hypothetical protein
MPLRQLSQRLEKNIFLSFRRELAVKLQPTMKHRNSATSTAQLLGTLSFRAAHAVDEAVRSAADSDVLRAVDSAVGQVFYAAVFEPVYKRTWCAIYATWRASAPPS